MTYRQCWVRFGWTPAQVDEMPAATLHWQIAIDNVVRARTKET